MEYEKTIQLILENPSNSLSESTKSLLETLGRSAELAKRKADKWDELDEKISKFYPESEQENDDYGDLADIGEIAAIALGYL